jgi:formylglycine-generating enzyme required for sulfatase activity
VPGGTFYRGYDAASDGAFTDMAHPATVSSFRLDTYEVTVGRFRQFVYAGMGTQASPPSVGAGARTLNGAPNQGGWDAAWNTNLGANTAALVAAVHCSATYETWTDTPAAKESLPMSCVTWFEAFAFCAWDGGFLPTAAEWNYAAVGGAEQRAYPWSSPAASLTIDCSYADYQLNGTTYCVNPPSGSANRVGSESPTGDGKWGQADLAGNQWEWALDWAGAGGALVNPCHDCAALTDPTYRSLQGGYFLGDEQVQRGNYHNIGDPMLRLGDVGFRCARLP